MSKAVEAKMDVIIQRMYDAAMATILAEDLAILRKGREDRFSFDKSLYMDLQRLVDDHYYRGNLK